MGTRSCLGTRGSDAFHKGWEDWSNISDIGQCLWYLRTPVENKASSVLLFGEQFLFDIVMNRAQLIN